MKRYIILKVLMAAAMIIPSGCNRVGREAAPHLGEPVMLKPFRAERGFEVVAEEIPTKATAVPTMEDFPAHDVDSLFKNYGDPVALFGFYLNSPYGGQTKPEVEASTLTSDQKRDVLQSDNNNRYNLFLNNSKYIYSQSAGAYVSNDLAAFWRPDSYHYFICYAPPLDVSVDESLVITLNTEEHGIQGVPDYNFIYGRRVLQYNNKDVNSPQHQTEGITMYMASQLAQLALHMQCTDDLKGSTVMFGLRVHTYKKAEFHLATGGWSFSSEDEETITRYFDDDYVIPTVNEHDKLTKHSTFTLSLFPNLQNVDDPIVEDTPRVVRKLEVCVNNTWVEVENIKEYSVNDDAGNHDSENPKPRPDTGEGHDTLTSTGRIPLVPGYVTDVYLTVSRASTDDWNKLIITFSNWKHDTIYEYNGTLE